MTSRILHGDCIEMMRTLPDASVDAVVTDPPYGIRFMGKAWDGADIDARHADRHAMKSHDPNSGPNGGHKSIASEAGKYDLAPASMRAFQEFSRAWSAEAFRVLKPGGHLLSFASPRTYHRMASGIEDAGFTIRDQIAWIFGSGFPKSLDVSKAIDKEAGARGHDGVGFNAAGIGKSSGGSVFRSDNPAYRKPEGITDAARKWEGWGTALKPAHEPICVARKPLLGTVAANVQAHGTGALNIDACRVGAESTLRIKNGGSNQFPHEDDSWVPRTVAVGSDLGRWPANVIHDGSDEVLAVFPVVKGATGRTDTVSGGIFHGGDAGIIYGDSGSAARFFYCAKASAADRNDGCEAMEKIARGSLNMRSDDHAERNGNLPEARANHHPTVKPTDLMRYLVTLVTPPGGVVLDPFMGSGSTGRGCALAGFDFIGCELDSGYIEIAHARIKAAELEAERIAGLAADAKRQSGLFT